MNGKNGTGIPWWVVIVGLCVAPPAGIILILLKIFWESRQKNASVSSGDNASASVKTGRVTDDSRMEVPAPLAKQKKKVRVSKVLHIVAIALFALTTFFAFAGLVSGVSGNLLAAAESGTAAACLAVYGAVCALASAIQKRQEQDTARYLTLIGNKESIRLVKLSDATSYRIRRVQRDMQRLIDAGHFGASAYIDASNLCFMRHPDAVPDSIADEPNAFYSRTMSGVAEDLGAVPSEGHREEVSLGIEDYDAVILKIRSLDDAIRDETVSARIRRMEVVTRNIFEYVVQNPEKKNQIRTFMNYYLPTTLKLLESYSLIERVGVTGQNMRDAKRNIEQTLDTLVAGFEQQFDQLYRAESVDISSDIEVLEQMMKRDGLKENHDFSPGRHSAEKSTAGASDVSGEGQTEGSAQP